jgi:hypothetical protein
MRTTIVTCAESVRLGLARGGTNLMQTVFMSMLELARQCWRRLPWGGAVLVLATAGLPSRVHAAAPSKFAGTWAFNVELSDAPREVGFDPDWQDSEGPANGRAGGGGGRSGGGGGGGGGRGGGGRRGGGGGGSPRSAGAPNLVPRLESEEDSKKVQQLIREVRTPPTELTIRETETSITIIDARDWSRTYPTNGREDVVQLDAGPVRVTGKWEGPQLVLRYKVEKDRELRYSLSRDASGRLQMLVQFAERNKGDVVKWVFDQAR